MGELERLRRRQTTRVPLIALATVPLAATVAAMQLEQWLLAGIAGTVGLIAFVAVGRRAARPGITNYEFKEGDHPAYRAWLPFAPAGFSLLAGPLVPELGAQPAVAAVGYTTLVALSLTAGWRAAETQPFRVGKRRIRRILATDDGLRGVTAGRLELARRHRPLLVTLVWMGAVDGAHGWAWRVAELTGRSPEEVVADARVLGRAGLLGLSAYPDGGLERNMGMWLTGTGVRVLAESGRR